VFRTNACYLNAATVAALDQQRGQIESFCNTMKQPLKLKTSLGTSENAVMTPLWLALMTYLIPALRRFKAGLGIALQQRLRLLQINRFDRRTRLGLFNPPQCPAAGGRQLCVA
jgi:hypothetical protein